MNGDDLNLKALGALAWTRVVRVGTGEGNDVRILNFTESAAGAEFALSWRGASWAQVKWSQPGLFNARNAAMAATAAGLALWLQDTAGAIPLAEPGRPERPAESLAPPQPDPTHLNLDGLARFRGVKRRQEILVSTPTLTVIEDFGHHPTALAETLHSFRARYPGAILTAVFEPRSNTARSKFSRLVS